MGYTKRDIQCVYIYIYVYKRRYNWGLTNYKGDIMGMSPSITDLCMIYGFLHTNERFSIRSPSGSPGIASTELPGFPVDLQWI